MNERLPCGWIWRLPYCETKKCDTCYMNKQNQKYISPKYEKVEVKNND